MWLQPRHHTLTNKSMDTRLERRKRKRRRDCWQSTTTGLGSHITRRDLHFAGRDTGTHTDTDTEIRRQRHGHGHGHGHRARHSTHRHQTWTQAQTHNRHTAFFPPLVPLAPSQGVRTHLRLLSSTATIGSRVPFAVAIGRGEETSALVGFRARPQLVAVERPWAVAIAAAAELPPPPELPRVAAEEEREEGERGRG